MTPIEEALSRISQAGLLTRLSMQEAQQPQQPQQEQGFLNRAFSAFSSVRSLGSNLPLRGVGFSVAGPLGFLGAPFVKDQVKEKAPVVARGARDIVSTTVQHPGDVAARFGEQLEVGTTAAAGAIGAQAANWLETLGSVAATGVQFSAATHDFRTDREVARAERQEQVEAGAELSRQVAAPLRARGLEALERSGQMAQDLPERPLDPTTEWFIAGLGQGIPTLAASVGAAVPAGLVGGPLAAGAAGFTVAAGIEGGFTYKDALDHGADEETARNLSYLVGVINGSLELFPVMKLIQRTGASQEIRRHVMREISRNVVRQGLEESSTEALQEVISNAFAKVYDENRSLFEGVGDAAFFGALLGGGAGGGATVVGGAIGQYRRTPPELREAGFLRLPGTDFDMSRYGVPSQRVAQSFEESTDQTAVPTDISSQVGNIEIGSFGRDALQRKTTSRDRFPVDQITSTLNQSFLVIPASNNPRNYRFDNIVFLSRDADTSGLRAVYTRQNKNGVLEIINAHRIPASNIARYFEDIGYSIPSGTRTHIASLEDSQLVQLAYGDTLNLSKQVELVKQHAGNLITPRPGALLRQAERIDRAATPSQTRRAIQEGTAPQDRIIQTSERALLLNRMRNARRIATRAAVATRQEVSQVQRELISLINDSNLEAKEKARLLKTVRTTQTQRQLARRLPRIEAVMERIADVSQKRALLRQIREDLKRTKPRTEQGKLKGKFTPEAERVLAPLRQIFKMSKEEAADALQKNIERYSEEIPPIEVSIQNHFLAIRADYRGQPVEAIETLAQQIHDIVEDGAVRAQTRLFNRQEEIERLKGFTKTRLNELPEGIETTGNANRTWRDAIKRFAKSWSVQAIQDWSGIMEMVDRQVTPNQKNLKSVFSTLQQENLYKQLEREFLMEMQGSVMEAYEITSNNATILEQKVNAKIRDINGKLHDLGTFENALGHKVKIKMTRDQAIKRHMEMMDPSLQETFVDGNHYTQEIMDAINNLLSDSDKRYAAAQLDMYRRHYDKVNEVYRRIYGVDLPFNDFYSPIAREGYEVSPSRIFGNLQEDTTARSSLFPGALITRTKSIAPLKVQSSTEVLMRHFTETNYFIAWADRVQELQGVWGDTDIQARIKYEFGGTALSTLNETIRHITQNGNKTALKIRAVDFLRDGFTIGALAAKPALTVKTGTALLTYLEPLGPVDFMAGAVSFMKDPLANARTLNDESTYIKERGWNLERDMKSAVGSGEYRRFSKFPSFASLVLLNVKMGDKGPILMGSWAIRRKALKEGKSLQEAINEYESFSSETHPSGDIGRLSLLQRGGSLFKIFTQFQSDPRIYMRKEVNAVHTLFKEGGTTPKNIRRVARILFIYHILLPVSFQFMANLGRTDDEAKRDYMRAAILGNFNNYFIFGGFAEDIVRAALGMPIFNSDTSVQSVPDKITRAMNILKQEDITAEDWYDAIRLFASTGQYLRIPTDYAFQIADGVGKIVEGNYKAGIANVLGWSDWSQGLHLPQTDEEKFLAGLKTRQDEVKNEVELLALAQLEELNSIEAQYGPEEAQRAFVEFYEQHPTLGDIIAAEKRRQSADLTPEDTMLLKLNVDNYFRSHAIFNLAMEKPEDERQEYIVDLWNKGIITKKVGEQLVELRKEADQYGFFEEGEVYQEKNILKRVVQYAQAGAFNVDAKTAFARIFQGETLNYVDPETGRVVVNRMPVTGPGSSQWRRREGGVTPENRDEIRLEHIIPIALGGSNQERNLKLVTYDQWSAFTKIDNLLIKAVQDKKIPLKEAQKLIKQFKEGKVTEDQIRDRVN